MITNYSNQPVEIGKTSIFLAGPTPRKKEVKSWRPAEACKYLEESDFDGIVYVPEYSDGKPFDNYDGQIEWEWKALDLASIILFWIPREIPDMPAFTTNVEFGYYVKDSKAIYGRPDTAQNMSYLDRLYKRHHDEMIFDNLKALCCRCVEILK